MTDTGTRRLGDAGAELVKLAAFFRRDLFVTLSYRMALLADWVGLVVQMVGFYYIDKLIDPTALPEVDGRTVSYLAFVTVGIAVSGLLYVGLGRTVSAIRSEQLMGTLEVLVSAPMSVTTLQLGLVAYDFAYVPIRTAILLIGISVLFGVDFNRSGLLPMLVLLMAFVPFVWGVGVASAASVFAFRRGASVSGLVSVVLGLSSGALFPLSLLPGWIRSIARWNPVAMTVDGAREAVLGTAGWAETLERCALLLPIGLVTVLIGFAGFRVALRYERRRGSIGLY